MDVAIGMIEIEGVAGVIVAADAVCKASEVELLGWESIGGFTTVFFEGPISAVNVSLHDGKQAANEIVEHVVGTILTRPEIPYRDMITFPIQRDMAVIPAALGLIETRGYGAHVFNNDRMVKSADVEVFNVLTVHNRVVCTLIKGAVEDVREAISVGREQLEINEYFLCSAIIPRPMPEVLQAFGQPD